MVGSNTRKNKTADMAYIAMAAALMAICSWIAIPAAVPFTMQTFGVFLAVGALGGRRGTMAVLVYLLLGMIGIPVFAGFEGGIGCLMGSTGGYLIGFVCTALVMWAMEKLPGNRTLVQVVSMVLGLIACYAFGTVWFMQVYAKANGAISWMMALSWSVFPFIIPDLLKIALALVVSRRISVAIRF